VKGIIPTSSNQHRWSLAPTPYTCKPLPFRYLAVNISASTI
jgi:hypothetical protein